MSFAPVLRAAPLALIVASFIPATPADARRVIIDGSVDYQTFTACTLGSTCAAIDLGFNISVNGLLTNSLYFYSNGLTSLGQSLAINSPPASIAGAGGNSFSAAYSSSSLSGSPRQGFGIDTATQLPVFRLEYLPQFDASNPITIQVGIYQLDQSGSFRLEFNYGRGESFGEPVAVVNPAALIGYAFGPTSFQIRAADELALQPNRIQDPNLGFSFDFNAAATAVPEPATWLSMIAGFGLAGAALRRRRAELKGAAV
jgi:hypothetical protein